MGEVGILMYEMNVEWLEQEVEGSSDSCKLYLVIEDYTVR